MTLPYPLLDCVLDSPTVSLTVGLLFDATKSKKKTVDQSPFRIGLFVEYRKG